MSAQEGRPHFGRLYVTKTKISSLKVMGASVQQGDSGRAGLCSVRYRLPNHFRVPHQQPPSTTGASACAFEFWPTSTVPASSCMKYDKMIERLESHGEAV
jgi:hypothetical protein